MAERKAVARKCMLAACRKVIRESMVRYEKGIQRAQKCSVRTVE